jgi:hypothetical protein
MSKYFTRRVYTCVHHVVFLRRYGQVDFSSLRGYQQSWDKRTCIEHESRAMTTACILHYNMEIPVVVRYLGGPHVASLRNAPHILRTVKPILDPTLFQSLIRILTKGTPAYCVAHSTDENYRDYRTYGNHRMLPPQYEKLRQSLVKEETRGFLFLTHNLLSQFVYNCHTITPYGVVVKPGKKDRPFSDGSFHPKFASIRTTNMQLSSLRPRKLTTKRSTTSASPTLRKRLSRVTMMSRGRSSTYVSTLI